MHEAVDLRLLRDASSLHRLEQPWRALWNSDPNATPFQSPEWLVPWWRQFGEPELATVTISRNGRLTGLLPFYVHRESPNGQRQLLLIGAGTSDYLDGLFAPDCAPEHIGLALRLLAASVSWHVGSMTQLRPGSKLLQAASAGAPRFLTEQCWRMPAVPSSGFPRKILLNVSQRSRRAHRQGHVEYALATGSTCREDFEALVRLHRERWQSRGEGGIFRDPRVLAWHREAVPLLAHRGLLWLFSLRLNGETIAAMYCLADPPGRAPRSLYVYIPAFSPRFATLSPGTLLLAHAIEQASAEGIATIDLLRGDESYKRLWHAEPTPTFGCDVPRRAGKALQPFVEAA